MNVQIIKNPRVTEKAAMQSAMNVYAFDVVKKASKKEIEKAIFELYKVKPVRVNVLKVPEKKINSRGKIGTRSGGKKALVYLKAGDKIEFI